MSDSDNLAWKVLPVFSEIITGPFLFNFKITQAGYSLHVTDLIHAWVDTATLAQIAKRGLEDKCVVDLTTSSNLNVLLEKLTASFESNPASHDSPFSLQFQNDRNLQIIMTEILHGSSAPLIWKFRLLPVNDLPGFLNTMILGLVGMADGKSRLKINQTFRTQVQEMQHIVSQKDACIAGLQQHVTETAGPSFIPVTNKTALLVYDSQAWTQNWRDSHVRNGHDREYLFRSIERLNPWWGWTGQALVDKSSARQDKSVERNNASTTTLGHLEAVNEHDHNVNTPNVSKRQSDLNAIQKRNNSRTANTSSSDSSLDSGRGIKQRGIVGGRVTGRSRSTKPAVISSKPSSKLLPHSSSDHDLPASVCSSSAKSGTGRAANTGGVKRGYSTDSSSDEDATLASRPHIKRGGVRSASSSSDSDSSSEPSLSRTSNVSTPRRGIIGGVIGSRGQKIHHGSKLPLSRAGSPTPAIQRGPPDQAQISNMPSSPIVPEMKDLDAAADERRRQLQERLAKGKPRGPLRRRF
ncbi:hypothetical protein V1514DRAFT_341980 [Lipomyces japonicus]|uniref:uncharacterized protein n=1 Tax=Lipomyces japonicus TaxID=56871 RepID=UPI0034D00485